jgi:hypothetical protein
MNEKSIYWKSEQIQKLFPGFKFSSWEAGLSSTEKNNLKRVGKVLDLLQELNSNNLKEESEHLFLSVRDSISELMREAGYIVSVNQRTQKYVLKKANSNNWNELTFKQQQRALIEEAKKQNYIPNIPFTKKQVREALKTDVHLNNLPLKKWDLVADSFSVRSFINSTKRKYHCNGGVSLADGVCFLKEYARQEYICTKCK